jgi:hypothetical protein
MSIEVPPIERVRPSNFDDKVRVYTKVPPRSEVLGEFQRLARGESTVSPFGADWTPGDYKSFLSEIGLPLEEEDE